MDLFHHVDVMNSPPQRGFEQKLGRISDCRNCSTRASTALKEVTKTSSLEILKHIEVSGMSGSGLYLHSLLKVGHYMNDNLGYRIQLFIYNLY